MTVQLKQIKIIGRPSNGNGRYAVLVKKAGVVSERSITAQQYEALVFAKGTDHLAGDGEEVIQAYADYLYDTASGKLDNGCFAEESTGRFLVKRDENTRWVVLEQTSTPQLTDTEDAKVTEIAKAWGL